MNTKSKSRSNAQSAQASAPKKPRSPWTGAFVQIANVSVSDCKDKVKIESEIELFHNPIRIDVVIIKLVADIVIDNAVMRFFKKRNIIEVKSPHDTLSIKAFDKIMAYFYAYLSEERYKDEPPLGLDDVTLSIISVRRPRKFMAQLQEERKYKIVDTETPGIYYIISGDYSPVSIQLVVASELPKDDNDKCVEWLRVFNNNLTAEEMNDVLEKVEDKDKDDPERALANFLIDVNPDTLKEVEEMPTIAQKRKMFIEGYVAKHGLIEKWTQQGEQRGMQVGLQQGMQKILAFLKQGHSVEEAERQFAFSGAR